MEAVESVASNVYGDLQECHAGHVWGRWVDVGSGDGMDPSKVMRFLNIFGITTGVI